MRFASKALGVLLTATSRTAAFAVPSLTTRQRTTFCTSVATVTRRRSRELASFDAPWQVTRGGASSTTTSTALNSVVADDATETKRPAALLRKDYQPLPFTVKTVYMDIHLQEGKTTVTTDFSLQRNPKFDLSEASNTISKTLVLDGDESAVKLLKLRKNGNDLVLDEDYTLEPGKLTLQNVQDGDVVHVVTEIVPEENTKLSGLYKSGGMYCTQCEAMGFRRITYYPDRPDNMSVFERVRIEGDKMKYPLLLSNGNLVEQGSVGVDRHYAVWSDPFPKPSYLFATVAGSLGMIEDSFVTASGRTVQLRLFSEPANVDKLYYAMDALKRSMKWDEERFGLEYDLDLFNVVAVNDFNMGAMENKSLNIFNTAYVLADKATATDTDFERVEAVIAHEYFHNWTGNRVTCRDWFQLTLKEGLTVFRDQEFSADMGSKSVKRVEDVRGLRARQFAEDAGPMAHSIRPDKVVKFDNFYTATVYTKGAEIIRMYQTILSKEGFRKGMDLYFQRHDGDAVTCDDFLSAMADANGVDLSQFARWYSTPGTPTVTYSSEYKDGVFSLTLSQQSRSSEGPLHIPVSVGLISKSNGEEVLPTTVLNLKEETKTFTFDGLDNDVVCSLLREFSAPVKLIPASGVVDEESMAFLAARDTDGFNRWEARQNLYSSLIFQTLNGSPSEKTSLFVDEAFERALTVNANSDYSIQSYTLMLPTESTLAEAMDVVDPIGIHEARGKVKKRLARKFVKILREKYDELTTAMEGEEFKVDAESIGRRRLRNVCLEYLCSIKDTDEEQDVAAGLAMEHFQKAASMTDRIAALTALASMDGRGSSCRDEALEAFYTKADGDALVLDKWFTVQAMADLPDVLERVKKLKDHPDFSLRNPNRCRSLLGAYAANSAAFHDSAGESYKFMATVLSEVDQINPQVSSRMTSSLIQWRRYDKARGLKMKAELEKLAKMKLSDDMFEIVTKGLESQANE